MAASDLRREYEAFVDREWGQFNANVLFVLKAYLPTSAGTNGVWGEYAGQGSLAGDNLYAKGDLRNSYQDVFLARYSAPGAIKTTALVSRSPYAYYYANGRRNSESYHGFDFISATKRAVEEIYAAQGERQRVTISGMGVWER